MELSDNTFGCTQMHT